MKALITGIAGFTGQHLSKLLRAQGIQVIGIDIDPKTKINCDLTDRQKTIQVIAKIKPDYIFHLASPILRGNQLIDDNLPKNLKVDLFGSINLLQAAANLSKKPKILITGTNAEYQITDKALKETDRLEPLTGYGLSKLTQELVTRKLALSYGLNLVYTRTFHLIGPGQSPGFAVTDFCKKVAEIESGKGVAKLSVGNLSISRDFTDVRDAAKAYLILMKKGKNNQAYNVCSSQSYSLKEIVDWLKQKSRKKLVVKTKKTHLRQNDPLKIVGNNKKLKSLGWQPTIPLEESLKDALAYWRKETKT